MKKSRNYLFLHHAYVRRSRPLSRQTTNFREGLGNTDVDVARVAHQVKVHTVDII